jgi:phage host-nuclease inhibitor protein Gam
MARYKPTPGKLETLEDVNGALREIGLLERELESIDGEAQKQIGETKASAAKQGEPLRKKITELSEKVNAFAEYNKADLFKDRKSVDLIVGVFGFRKSTSISVKKTTVALLVRQLTLGREKIDPDRHRGILIRRYRGFLSRGTGPRSAFNRADG